MMYFLRFYLLMLSSLLLGYLSVATVLSMLHGWAPAMLSFNRYNEGWIEVVLLLVLTPVSAYMSYREWRKTGEEQPGSSLLTVCRKGLKETKVTMGQQALLDGNENRKPPA